MKTKIENENEFKNAIDQLGKTQLKIEAATKEAKAIKGLLEAYALETGTNRFKTDDFLFKMSVGSPALKRLPEICEADVVALLKRDESTREFVSETYDTAALKNWAAATDDPEEYLSGFGLFLTTPKRHAEVTERNS